MAAQGPCAGESSNCHRRRSPRLNPVSTLQRLLDLYHHNTAPAAAILIASLLPKPTQSAVLRSCKAGRELVRQVVTHLTVDLQNDPVEHLQSLNTFPELSSLTLSGSCDCDYKALHDGVGGPEWTLDRVQSLTLKGALRETIQHAYEMFLCCGGSVLFLDKCTSLRELSLCDQAGDVTVSLELPGGDSKAEVLFGMLPVHGGGHSAFIRHLRSPALAPLARIAKLPLVSLMVHSPFANCVTRQEMPYMARRVLEMSMDAARAIKLMGAFYRAR